MLNLAVVDDERENRELLSGFINRYAQENNLSLAVTAFADGAQIAEPYQGGFDIIFLDIEMPMLGGMTAAERIRAADPDVPYSWPLCRGRRPPGTPTRQRP